MPNTRRAAAEGLSTPDREISPLERMQGMASAWMNATPEAREHALAASRTFGHEEVTALMTYQSPVLIAIQQHHKALAELDALGLAQVAAEEAHIAANRTDPQLAEVFEAADAAFNESCSRQSDAHEAVLSAPVLTLSEMQVKAAHLADTIQHIIHDASTMRKLLASVAQPTDEDSDSIERMYAEWNALFTRDASDETDEQADSTYAVFEALQSRIINAPARSARDVALQFMADTHNNTSDPSDEFTEVLARLATASGDPAPVDFPDHLFPSAVRQSALNTMSIQDLDGLHSAATTLFSVTAGLCNWPKFGRRDRTHAGKAMDSLNDLLANCIDAVIAEARVRAPETAEDERCRAWLLLRYEAEGRDTLAEVSREITFLQRKAETTASADSTTICTRIETEAADPLLALVTEYRTQLDTFNASPSTLSRAEDAELEAKTWAPSYAVLHGGEVPKATTLPGVLAALRELHREFVDCGGADEMAIAMLPAVVAFFDAEAAQTMRDRAAALADS